MSSAQRVEDGFRVHVEGAGAVAARRLLLALGVVDDLPAIEGLRERWGHGGFHCPHCHSWEMRDRPLAVLGNGT
ncbi:MAG TPA: thioredoxin reductase, partial [Geodermatophilus sp.]|nr:thioredoxin reductase [Geodermatophilus sp.]